LKLEESTTLGDCIIAAEGDAVAQIQRLIAARNNTLGRIKNRNINAETVGQSTRESALPVRQGRVAERAIAGLDRQIERNIALKTKQSRGLFGNAEITEV